MFPIAARGVCMFNVSRRVSFPQADSGVLQLISEISRKVDSQHSDTLRASAAVVADWFDATEGSELKAKVLASVADLQKGLLERDTEVCLLRAL